MDSFDDDQSNRRNFIRHFAYLGSSLRFPCAYAQFSGKPNGSHEHIVFDERGFRNTNKQSYFPNGYKPRIFVLGGSTMVEGSTEDDTVPGRLETALKRVGFDHAQVFNFGVVSTCYPQMSTLLWSHLATLRPDAVVVVGGGTDITNPWTFDPRPGYPYNAFVIEEVYDYLFDTNRILSRELGLSYDDLTDLLYKRLGKLRTQYGWRTEDWESGIIESTRQAMRSFSALASTLQIPILCVLQPTIVRKKQLSASERDAGSHQFLCYLDRQYARLEEACCELSRLERSNRLYRIRDFSRLFENQADQIFYDAAHYLEMGRQIMAESLVVELFTMLEAYPQQRLTWGRPIRHLREMLRTRS